MCDLIEGPLSLMEFEAISYSWGVALRPYTIKVNGKPFYIGYNLYSALKKLRNTDHERLLWADAMCINQHNYKEKSNQVQMMQDIFSKASNVVVWLGKSDSATSPTFEFIRQFGAARTEEMDILWENHITGPTWKRMQAEYVRIFEHNWWSRAWVVEEVVVGRHVVMQCGSFQAEWEAIHKLFTYRPFANNEFCNLVIRFRLQLATFGSDNIYALLGLLKSNNPSLIKPDYSKSPDEVFIQFTESCMIHKKNLDILGFASGVELNGASWFRDWRLTYDEPYTFKTKRLLNLEPSRPFSASGPIQPMFQIDRGLRVLAVAGCHIDTIKKNWNHTHCWRVEPVDWRTRIKPQQEHSHDDEGRDYRLTVRNACTNIYFFMTKDGRFGLGPPSLEEGDTIAVLLGGKTPFILRPCVNRRSAKIPSATYYYKLVGEAFVDGLMYQDGSLQDDGLRDFLLI
ncbi:heterokaryon incompatibility protein-domain-containing protein [Bipolaris maydis]|nr:heterokaryon incompatibility protein-domain-containing protein [Bipolaris maydis]